MRTWLIDTGPLVALLVQDDSRHLWAVEAARQSPPTVLTCDAVISETLFLLKRGGHSIDSLFALVDAGFVHSDFDFHAQYRHVRELMNRYRDRPMAFADACLVRMAELRPEASVWTLDSDFRFYRMNRRQTLSLVMPEGETGG